MLEPGGQRVYSSGEWELNVARRELLCRGLPTIIGGRPFEIIQVLVQSAGELVTKDDLIGRVWPGAIVEENTLQAHISAIRKALGPDRGMLKTISGRGYRLLGSWTVRQEEKSADPVILDVRVRSPQFQTNLPAPATNLVGRAAAVLHLQDLLSVNRVITLTGPGGIGKTALALEVARSLLPTFLGDGILVELVSLSDPGTVPARVASVLGLMLRGDEISSEAIARAIGEKKLLLVLDNCEHVVDAAAKLAETFVRMCPRTIILATSRELLRIDGEHVYRVPPLDVPPAHLEESERVLGYSAAQLFVARTTALHSDFQPRRESIAAIAAICRQLDGIPLAIEFAAARAATLGVEQVASRLDDRFGLLTGGRRTALPRHQTLRAMLDWSYELLSEPERHLLRRLAIFPAGFTIEAATAVMRDTGYTATAVVDAIANLVSKSLVTLDGSAPARRWRLLETIRAYMIEKLAASGEAEHAARRHAEFFRDLFVPPAGSPLQSGVEGLARYAREIDNVRAALDWCFSVAGDSTIGIALTAAYVPVWLNLSLAVECRERAERALENTVTDSILSAALRLQLHTAFGTALLQSTGAEDRTGVVLSKALEIAENVDDPNLELRAVWAMWSFQDHRGEHRAAKSLAQHFVQVARRKGDQADILVGDRLMGLTMHYLGNQDEARRYLDRFLDNYVAPDDRRHEIWFQHDQRVVARLTLARVLCLQGLVDQSRDSAQASLESAQAADHTLTLRYVLGWGLCPVSLILGDLDTAAASVRMLIDLAARRRLPFWQTVGRALEGALLIKRGEFASGSTLLQNALNTQVSPKWAVRFPDFLGALAEGLAGMGRFTEALATVDDALANAENGGVKWYVAELLRIKGEFLLQSATDQASAEACFLAATEVARQQGALLWELRAAAGLARLVAKQDRPRDARQLLAPVLDKFTEGFDTADLRSVIKLLDSLPIAGEQSGTHAQA